MDNRDQQSAIAKAEHANTLRIQKAGNGFIVKQPVGDPMVFMTFKEASQFMETYFSKVAKSKV